MSDPAFIFWFFILSALIIGGLHLAGKLDESSDISPFVRWRSTNKIEEEKGEV